MSTPLSPLAAYQQLVCLNSKTTRNTARSPQGQEICNHYEAKQTYTFKATGIVLVQISIKPSIITSYFLLHEILEIFNAFKESVTSIDSDSEAN